MINSRPIKAEISDLLVFNEALVVSDRMNARLRSLTASKEWFMPWRTRWLTLSGENAWSKTLRQRTAARRHSHFAEDVRRKYHKERWTPFRSVHEMPTLGGKPHSIDLPWAYGDSEVAAP